MKKILFIFSLTMLLLGISSCVQEQNDEKKEMIKLSTPTISISSSGLASWDAVSGATSYIFIIDDGEEVATTILSVQLLDNQAICVKAVGDNLNYLDSDFSVTMKYEVNLEEDYGELIVNNITMTVGVPTAPTIIFTNPKYQEEVNFDFSSEKVNYLDGYFVASAKAIIKIRAYTSLLETTFILIAEEYEGLETWQITKRDEKKAYYEANWNKTEGGSVVIGDSFFDTEFWSTFYSTFENGNTFINGVSGSTAQDWTVLATDLLFPLSPSEVIIHIGTNDIYDDKCSSDETIGRITNLFDLIHSKLPNAKLYWFAIEPRTYSVSNFNLAFDDVSYSKITIVNNAIKKISDDLDYLTYLDVSNNCYVDTTTTPPLVNSDFFRDGTHPKIGNYSYYIDALLDCGVKFVENNNSTNDDFNIAISSVIASTNHYLYANGSMVQSEFLASGKLKITSCANNGHIQFNFDGSNFDNRILLWDNDGNKTFTLGHNFAGSNHTNTSLHSISLNEEVSWKLLVSNRHVYFYLNNVLVLIFLNCSFSSPLAIGAESTAVSFYDIEVSKSTDYLNSLKDSIVSRYEGFTSYNQLVLTSDFETTDLDLSSSIVNLKGGFAESSGTFTAVSISNLGILKEKELDNSSITSYITLSNGGRGGIVFGYGDSGYYYFYIKPYSNYYVVELAKVTNNTTNILYSNYVSAGYNPNNPFKMKVLIENSKAYCSFYNSLYEVIELECFGDGVGFASDLSGTKFTSITFTNETHTEYDTLVFGHSYTELWTNYRNDLSNLAYNLNMDFGSIGNIGIGGSIAEHWEEFEDSIVSLNPKLAIYNIGINDLAWGKSPSQIVDSIENLLVNLKTRLGDDFKVVLLSINHCPDRVSYKTKISNTNELMKEMASRYEWILYADVEYAFCTVDGDATTANTALFTDGLHPTKEGYALIVKAIKNVLK